MQRVLHLPVMSPSVADIDELSFVLMTLLCSDCAGGPTGYDQQSYVYAQQPAAAQAPPSDGSWLAQYQTSTADYSAYPYQQAGQPAAYDALNTQQYAAVGQPPPPPIEVPPPPPV